MYTLDNIEPGEVFRYFKEIAAIPHGSRNTAKISDYLVAFATGHGLKYRQDKSGNVIIHKDGKGDTPVILQGHMDMVCEKEAGCDKDMDKEGLDLYMDGDELKARGTTLGGDDGIAVAMTLAILDSDDTGLPPIEAIFTVDEEIGMLGAAAIDVSDIESRTMINIDSEEEGIFTVSCAGGVVARASVAVERDVSDNLIGPELIYAVKVAGLTGGHSGIEIHKNRANAIVLLGRVLQRLRDDVGIRILDIRGGAKDNAIPVEAEAVIAIDEYMRDACGGICELCAVSEEEQSGSFMSGGPGPANAAMAKKRKDESEIIAEINTMISCTIDRIKKDITAEYAATDPELNILCQPIEGKDISLHSEEPISRPMTAAITNRIIYMLTCLPNGIQRMSPDVEGLVQTSLNMGILDNVREKGLEDRVVLTFCVRSSVASEKDMLMRRLRDAMYEVDGHIEFEGDYPGWQYRVDSPLREIMREVYISQYGREPEIEAVHAGVECGFFADKLPGLDCVSIGPDLSEIHTYRESMNVPSVKRTYRLVTETLKRIASDR